jgi:hypothetical protein
LANAYKMLQQANAPADEETAESTDDETEESGGEAAA